MLHSPSVVVGDLRAAGAAVGCRVGLVPGDGPTQSPQEKRFGFGIRQRSGRLRACRAGILNEQPAAPSRTHARNTPLQRRAEQWWRAGGLAAL